jgi:hypothetical protein
MEPAQSLRIASPSTRYTQAALGLEGFTFLCNDGFAFFGLDRALRDLGFYDISFFPNTV